MVTIRNFVLSGSICVSLETKTVLNWVCCLKFHVPFSPSHMEVALCESMPCDWELCVNDATGWGGVRSHGSFSYNQQPQQPVAPPGHRAASGGIFLVRKNHMIIVLTCSTSVTWSWVGPQIHKSNWGSWVRQQAWVASLLFFTCLLSLVLLHPGLEKKEGMVQEKKSEVLKWWTWTLECTTLLSTSSSALSPSLISNLQSGRSKGWHITREEVGSIWYAASGSRSWAC